MSILKITTDGDPYPAYAGTNLVNNGSIRQFPGGERIRDQIDADGNRISYDIQYRGGTGGRVNGTLVSLDTPNPQTVGLDEQVGVSANGVALYGATTNEIVINETATSFTGLGYTWNLPYVTSYNGLDNCGGRPEGTDGEYRYRHGRFVFSGFENNAEFTNSSKYFSDNTFGGSEVTRHGTMQYEGVEFTAGHSKIIGWALDGYPIYGPYGYTNPLAPNGTVSIMRSSYELIDVVDIPDDRPDVNTYGLGAFVEDYRYNSDTSTGTLDRFNGRYCITPDFKQGTYAYFLTFEDGNTEEGNVSTPDTPAYPYIVGPRTREQRTR